MPQYINTHGLPRPIELALMSDEYSLGEGDISTTGAMNSPRQRQLAMRHSDEIIIDVMSQVWSMSGTAMHHVLENAKIEGAIVEKMMYIELEGMKVKAQPDYIYPIQVGMAMLDLKNTSIYSVMDGPKEDWVKQLNIYNLIAQKNEIPITQLQIVAILRDWSWNTCHREKKENYPDAQIQTIDIPIWDLADTESYLKSRLVLHQAAESIPDEDLPFCTDEERWVKNTGWACEYVSGHSKGKAAKGAACLASASAAENYQTTRRAKAKLKGGGYKKGFVDTKVVFRPGESVRCERYCPAREFCNQFKNQGRVDPF